MTTKMIDLNETSIQSLDELLAELEKNTEIVLTKGNSRIALIISSISTTPQRKRVPNLTAGEIWVSDDFDAPLPDDFWFGDDEPSV